MIENFFDYIIIMAFESLLMYGDQKKLKYEQLHNYRMYLVSKIKLFLSKNTYLSNNTKLYEDAKQFIDSNILINSQIEKQLFKHFIDNNKSEFKMDGDGISITDYVNPEQLFSYRMSVIRNTQLYSLFQNFQSDLDLLDIIDANKVKNNINSIINAEKINELLFSINTDNQLINVNQNNSIVSSIINYLIKQSSYYVARFIKLFNIICNTQTEYKNFNDLKELNLFSDYLERKDTFYKKYFENNLIDLRTTSTNKYMLYAMFTDEQLYIYKIANYLDIVYEEKLIEDNTKDNHLDDDDLDEDDWDVDEENDFIDETDYDNQDDDYLVDNDEWNNEEYNDDGLDINNLKQFVIADTLFYLNYISAINNYISRYSMNDDLLKTKKRMLYFLDQKEYGLYDDKNIFKAINNLSKESIDDPKYYNEFYIFSRLFISDIIVYDSIDCNTLKKILFIYTYYKMSNDERIISYISEFNTDVSKKLYNAVVNQEFYCFGVKPDDDSKLKKHKKS